MSSIRIIPVRCVIATLSTMLLAITLLASACSGSGDAQPASDTATDNTDQAGGADNVNSPILDTDPIAQEPTTPAQLVTVRVDFEITVPAYQSDALLLSLEWGDEQFSAKWIGDQLWQSTIELPGNTEHQLSVTFLDDNGAITLGSFSQNFKTGSNDMQLYTITADQFDTDKWDSDGDGASNLSELIAGTDVFDTPQVLLFSETRGYRHDSIATALDVLEELALANGIRTVRSDDSAGVFTEANLAGYAAVVWVLTSGNVLDANEQAAFETYIRTGGGYAGIHAASDTEYDWPWYGGLVGAWFARHPEIQMASQNVEDASHPSTAHLSARWTRTDEWYDYSHNPRAQVNVLLSLDEASYSGGGMGGDHPAAWYHVYDGGRSWYTGGGHTKASYSEPDFRVHLLGGLLYAAGVAF